MALLHPHTRSHAQLSKPAAGEARGGEVFLLILLVLVLPIEETKAIGYRYRCLPVLSKASGWVGFETSSIKKPSKRTPTCKSCCAIYIIVDPTTP